MSFDTEDIASAISLGFFLMYKIVKEEGKLREPTDSEIQAGLLIFLKMYKNVKAHVLKETQDQDKIH